MLAAASLALVLGGPASAGPLDRPDPEDMGRYRCVERPLGAKNDVPLVNRTLGDGPPGPPTFPSGVGSSLVPYAADAALKKAGKKHKLVVYPAAATLATRGEPVVADCENRALDDSHFAFGCDVKLACELYTRHDGEALVLDRRPQAASRFSPVEEVRDAVGLVAFYEPDLFLPLTPNELSRWEREAADYRVVEPQIPWIEVEKRDEGWLIRAPRRLKCGCDRDIVRRAYWVSKDGRGCMVDEPGVPLAQLPDTEDCEKD
jgi:hypothetical protein